MLRRLILNKLNNMNQAKKAGGKAANITEGQLKRKIEGRKEHSLNNNELNNINGVV